MPAPLSIVVPTLNASAKLPAMADALLEGVTSGLVADLVISDGGSGDGIEVMAEELGAVLVTGPAGRGGQLKRGVEAASGEWVLLLHADTNLAAGWAEAVYGHITVHPDQAAWFRLRFRADGGAPKLVAAGANWRSRVLGLPYGDQGLVVSKAVLEEVGGVPDLPLMEDVALARALRGRLRGLGVEALTSAERYERDGWARRVVRNLGTLGKYWLGVTPEKLRARYEK